MAANEVYTFGVTPATLATWIGGFVATTTTRPTYAEVEEIITEEAGAWCAMLVQLGVPASAFASDTTSVCYTQSRLYIGARSAARAARAKDRNNQDFSVEMDDRADKLFKQLQANPALFGAARDVSDTAPGLTYVAPITNPALYRKYVDNGTVAQRSAAINRM